MSESAPTTRQQDDRPWRPDLVYSALLLATAVAAVALAAADTGLLSRGYGFGTVGFFLVFGLFTIATGFPHPAFGHVSFDRVAQVMSILVLGPVDAAWVNGLASLIYPWQRLRLGVSLPLVVTASLHNAGLMMLVILGGGLLYEYIGGAVPMTALNLDSGMLALVLVFSMQLINDVGMMFMLYLRNTDPRLVFNGFTMVVEYVAAAAGVVLAIAFTNEALPYFVLLLAVFAAGMLVIMKYALMRVRLEKLVDERTEELRVQAEEFERQATHDKLTGLPNRRHADSYLQQQVDIAQRRKRAGTLALADVDHFKRINDAHGHALGDVVLQQTTRAIQSTLRSDDIVGRFGGEEFVVLLPGADVGQALGAAERCRAAIESMEIPGAPYVRVTASVGVAAFPEHGAELDRLLRASDQAMYRAKANGRNRIQPAVQAS